MSAVSLWSVLLACSVPVAVTDKQVSDSDGEDTDAAQPAGKPSTDGIAEHLDALAQIAEDNGGTRAAGTQGYADSAAYVAGRLEEAGYTVTWQAFSFTLFTEDAEPTLSVGGERFAPGADIETMSYSGSGAVKAPVSAVDVQLPPGEANSSTSGCTADDFEGFPAGNIALVQRGSCTFGEKALNAQAAGAVGVILFNEGQDGRRGPVDGTLGEDAELTIPVLGASFRVGERLAGTDELVEMSATTSRTVVETHNLLADHWTGDPEQAVVVGAHLDSVQAGAGINDNGTGSAAVLELAEEIARLDLALTSRVRFAFWGAEELGLLGSTHYVSALSEDERDDILANLNFDMIASPNYVRFVYDGDGSDTPEAGPAGSGAIEERFVSWFAEQGLDCEPSAFSGRSDYGPFIAVGIPAGGLFTGAEVTKSNLEAKMYGGTAGEPYDPCYHQTCDGRDNISADALAEMSGAMFAVTLGMAQEADPIGTARRTRPRHDLAAGLHELPRRGKHFQR